MIISSSVDLYARARQVSSLIENRIPVLARLVPVDRSGTVAVVSADPTTIGMNANSSVVLYARVHPARSLIVSRIPVSHVAPEGRSGMAAVVSAVLTFIGMRVRISVGRCGPVRLVRCLTGNMTTVWPGATGTSV